MEWGGKAWLRRGFVAFCCLFMAGIAVPEKALSAEMSSNVDEDLYADAELWNDQDSDVHIADPLEPWNRLWFEINDRLYFWVLKPVARGYAAIIPEQGRVMIRNFFHNLSMPIHFVNALLQGKIKQAGAELGRFVFNTWGGFLGFFDVAEAAYDLKAGDEDFGQTLGVWGMGDDLYLVWPVIGPSNGRDTIGKVADTFMNPLTYYPEDFSARAAIFGFKTVNNTSLRIGEYESLKKAALDPYVSLRNAYTQMRRKEIKE
ncbi:MAG: VacJ family lipoprotein [Magnetococcales bacterium]|nr:VacJ family lipoprotein [Magnetococcales bacterium]